MKIGFVGIEGSGKTTISKLLAERMNLPHLPDPFNEAVKWIERSGQSLDKPDSMTFSEYFRYWPPNKKWLFEQAMHHGQYLLEADKSDFVTDSAMLQRIACALVYCCMDVPEKELKSLIDRAKVYCFEYDYIIMLQSRYNVIDNGHRFQNSNVSFCLDLLLMKLAEIYLIASTTVTKGPLILTVPSALSINESLDLIVNGIENSQRILKAAESLASQS